MIPRPVRPMLFTPLWIVLAIVCTVASPLLLVLALVASALTRRRQPLLLLQIALVYLLRELAVILVCAGLWVVSIGGRRIGTERFQSAHYRLMRWLLGGIVGEAVTALRIEVRHEPTLAAEQALRDHRRPLLIFSRHAGPGDSFLIVYLLLARFGRRPRIVMKRALALDPCIDLLCHRLPNALIDSSDQDECLRQIAALAAGMDGRGALVLFPEGGNFTPERRRRAIDRLRREGHRQRARRAEQLRHMVAPRPGGALAALRASPQADVIFAAHTGLGHQAFASELWRRLPSDRTLQMRMWLSPAGERPTDPDEQVEWMDAWWKRMDGWIAAQGTESPSGEPDGAPITA